MSCTTADACTAAEEAGSAKSEQSACGAASLWSGLTGKSCLWHLKGRLRGFEGNNKRKRRREGNRVPPLRETEEEGWEDKSRERWGFMLCYHPLSNSINTAYSWETGKGPPCCIFRLGQRKRATPTTGQLSLLLEGRVLLYTHTKHTLTHSLWNLCCIKKQRRDSRPRNTPEERVITGEGQLGNSCCHALHRRLSCWRVWQDLSAPAPCTLVSWFIPLTVREM